MSAIDDVNAAIAGLGAVLDRVDDDIATLHKALVRFDHEAVLTLALRLEHTVASVKDAEAVVVDAWGRARAAGVAERVVGALVALQQRAVQTALQRQKTAVLVERARGFNRAHQQALLPPTQAYGRRARFVDGAVASSMRTSG